MAGNAATPLPAAADPMKGILDILGQFGTGKTTSTTSSEPSDAATQQMQDLLKEISGSSSPEALNTLVQNILLKAKESFGPNIAASIGAGNRTASDSSLALIQGNVAARATAESAAAVHEARNNANKLATQLAETRMNASRRTTSTQQTGITPGGRVIAGLGAYRQLTGFGGRNTKSGNKNMSEDEILAEASGGKQNYIEQGIAAPTATGPGAVTDTIPMDLLNDPNAGTSLTEGTPASTDIPLDTSTGGPDISPEDTSGPTGPTGPSSTAPGSLNPASNRDPTNPPPE